MSGNRMRLPDLLGCNSIGQFLQLESLQTNNASLGLRLNPQLSVTEDKLYDPCRQFSKLGVPIEHVADARVLQRAKGLHFHTVFGSTDYAPLNQYCHKITRKVGRQHGQYGMAEPWWRLLVRPNLG
jgi:carboxynorspermidine decarboxylase